MSATYCRACDVHFVGTEPECPHCNGAVQPSDDLDLPPYEKSEVSKIIGDIATWLGLWGLAAPNIGARVIVGTAGVAVIILTTLSILK